MLHYSHHSRWDILPGICISLYCNRLQYMLPQTQYSWEKIDVICRYWVAESLSSHRLFLCRAIPVTQHYSPTRPCREDVNDVCVFITVCLSIFFFIWRQINTISSKLLYLKQFYLSQTLKVWPCKGGVITPMTRFDELKRYLSVKLSVHNC